MKQEIESLERKLNSSFTELEASFEEHLRTKKEYVLARADFEDTRRAAESEIARMKKGCAEMVAQITRTDSERAALEKTLAEKNRDMEATKKDMEQMRKKISKIDNYRPSVSIQDLQQTVQQKENVCRVTENAILALQQDIAKLDVVSIKV